MKKYKLKKAGKCYVIVDSNGPVRTPSGNEYVTADKGLARLVCEDMNQYGSSPMESSSFVTLHASYIDFGCTVPKQELARSISIGYTPDWDVALRTFREFNNLIHTPPSMIASETSGVVLDPVIYFGPLPESSEIISWLNGLSRRALTSVQVCGGTFHSVLLGYCLLQPKMQVQIMSLAKAIIHFNDELPDSLYVSSNNQQTEENVIAFLEKIRQYAFFSEE